MMPAEAEARNNAGLTYRPIEGTTADAIIVPENYSHNVIIRWGDSLRAGKDDLESSEILNDALVKPGAAHRQSKQFGYNCDLNAYFPFSLTSRRSSSRRGLMCVNHEYVNPELMFVNWPEDSSGIEEYVKLNPEAVRVMQEAHGVTIVEIKRRTQTWEYHKGSKFNRRITATTPIKITGPAAGDPLLQTSADPEGKTVLGMVNNCAGGKTPWGTVLTCEENVDRYFGNYEAYKNDSSADPNVIDAHESIPPRDGLDDWGWLAVDDRYDVSKEPKEMLRYGYVVEIDPYDPDAPAKKRTALGRFKHEGANYLLAPNNQVAIYSGDDERFEYLYKFVTAGIYDPDDRDANLDLLDDGILYVAKFNDDGTGVWLPLVFGQNGLTPENGFANQAEVLIKSRKAGDVLGATPMDRPEDVEANQVNRKVYMALTNNSRRAADDTDAANPRGPNLSGHILEITEDNGTDPRSVTFVWEIFILCGIPNSPDGTYLTALTGDPIGTQDTYYAGFPDPSVLAPLGSPDNIAFDNKGNMWIATDGSPNTTGNNDGVFPVPVEGPNRGKLQQFLSGPAGCEICGPEFNLDNTAFFCNIQHPGEGGNLKPGGPVVSTWPDGEQPGDAWYQGVGNWHRLEGQTVIAARSDSSSASRADAQLLLSLVGNARQLLEGCGPENSIDDPPVCLPSW
ncbi:MAG: PhoX family phosphatase, partial [Rhodospirillales bacterium]|nr:PhoX family phosphatase [Rhodospirillales bacterium]